MSRGILGEANQHPRLNGLFSEMTATAVQGGMWIEDAIRRTINGADTRMSEDTLESSTFESRIDTVFAIATVALSSVSNQFRVNSLNKVSRTLRSKVEELKRI